MKDQKWVRVNTRQHCPICNKAKGCLVSADGQSVVCLRVGSDVPVAWGLGGFLHRLNEGQASTFAAPVIVPNGPARRAGIDFLHRVYRFLLQEHGLSAEDRSHLQDERRLSLEAIESRGYASWGMRQRWKLAKRCSELHGLDVVDVPGIIVRRQQDEKDYLTLAGGSGIAIPVRDVQQRIQGIQLRLHDPKPGAGRYVWLSSASYGGATVGTPVHVARPLRPKPSRRVWLTEGPLKADIACDLLGEIVVAVPGIRAVADFIPVLEELFERGEVAQLVVAFDSDWTKNPDVEKARALLAERAARSQIPVWLAEWSSQYKGLDDLLVAGEPFKLVPYKVQGNGPRQLLKQEKSKGRVASGPTIPIEKARSEQSKTLMEFLANRPLEGVSRGLLMRSKPGLGKSTVMTDVLNKYTKNRRRARALFFVPRYDLAAGAQREDWEMIRGRTYSSQDQPPCTLYRLQNQMASLRVGGQEACVACPLLELCKTNTERKAGQPYYHAQFQHEKKIATHPVQHFLHPGILAKAQTIVFDDCDLRDLSLENIQVSRTQIEGALAWALAHPEHPYAKSTSLLRAFLEMLRGAPPDDFLWQEVSLFQQLESSCVREQKMPLKNAIEEALQAQEPDPFLRKDNDLQLVPNLPFRFVRELATVLEWELVQYENRNRHEWEGWNSRVRVTRALGGDILLKLKLRRDLPLAQLRGKDLIIIDASLTLQEAQQLFPDRTWTVIDPPVELPRSVTIHQFAQRAWGRMSLRTPSMREKAFQLIEEVVERHRGEKIALLTHKFFAKEVQQKFPELVVGHFFGQRGSNQFADCDVQIVFGTPFPNPQELEEQAQALYWDQERVLRQTYLERQFLGTTATEELYASVRTHADPRLRELQRSKCQEELVQAIYRIRPLSVEDGVLFSSHGRAQATVYVFSSLPLPLTVRLEPPVATTPSPVADLSEAVGRLNAEQLRVTEVRLAEEGRVNRYQARKFCSSFVARSRLGLGPPPAQGPPQAS